MLSCSCGSDCESWYEATKDFTPLNKVYSRKCASCEERIPVGAPALMLLCYREPRSLYEEHRFGEEVPMAEKYYCEKCGEIYMNLTAVGYCLNMGDMREAQQEYWGMTGFDPAKYKDAQ